MCRKTGYVQKEKFVHWESSLCAKNFGKIQKIKTNSSLKVFFFF